MFLLHFVEHETLKAVLKSLQMSHDLTPIHLSINGGFILGFLQMILGLSARVEDLYNEN